MSERAIKKCNDVRLHFWRQWLGPESRFPQARSERLKPDRPLPRWAVDALPPDAETVRILDLNAGPVTSLGNQAPGRQIELVPVDPLAHAFRHLLEEQGLESPVPTLFCSAEDILPVFGEEAFDLVYSFNGLDFTRDPVATYRLLLKALKPGGSIITFHEANPPEERINREWYRFFHYTKNTRVVIRQKTYRRDLQDALPEAEITHSIEGNLLRLDVRPAKKPKTVSLSRCLGADSPPPRLISMHIPKCGGTSFRSFLEDLYGNAFRPMYAEAETAPRLAHKLKLDPETRCLHGHFQADAFDGKRPDALKLTWLRHPIERMVSLYFQFHRHPESAEESSFNTRLFEEGWSLLEFAGQPEIRRQVRWYFNAVPLDDFFFIGISERYTECMRLLCHLLGRPAPAALPENNVNPNKKTGAGYALSAYQRHGLESLMAEEIELYRFIEYRLDRQLARAFGRK